MCMNDGTSFGPSEATWRLIRMLRKVPITVDVPEQVYSRVVQFGRRQQIQNLYSVGSNPTTATKFSPVPQLAAGIRLKPDSVSVQIRPGLPQFMMIMSGYLCESYFAAVYELENGIVASPYTLESFVGGENLTLNELLGPKI